MKILDLCDEVLEWNQNHEWFEEVHDKAREALAQIESMVGE
jgi:hypothetical protein